MFSLHDIPQLVWRMICLPHFFVLYVIDCTVGRVCLTHFCALCNCLHGRNGVFNPFLIHDIFIYIALFSFVSLKGQCHEIFFLYFFHESKPFGPGPNKPAKMFFLKNLFSRRYSNLSSKNLTPCRLTLCRVKL